MAELKWAALPFGEGKFTNQTEQDSTLKHVREAEKTVGGQAMASREFQLSNRLLYFCNSGVIQLVVPKLLQQWVFKLAHDHP